MNRKPIFESTVTDTPNTFHPAPATDYQVQVTSPYENHPNYQQPSSSQLPQQSQPQSIQLSSSYSVVNTAKPLRNRLSNVGFISPDFIDDVEQNHSRPSHQFPSFSYDPQKLPERQVNYQIKIKPSHHSNSKPRLQRPSKQLQTSTYNNNYVSHLAPIPESFPLRNPDISKFNPPQPIFGFRPNFYPFPLETTFHQRRGAFQKFGSFHFPSLPAHFPYFEDNLRHLDLDRQRGIHLPSYGYLIFNPKRGPPFYIIPEHLFEPGLDNEFHPSHNELQSSIIKPRKLL